jgi:hypothetical protein
MAKPTLYVPSDRKSASFFNKEALAGFVSFSFIGAIVGSYIGKQNQQREIDTGTKEVKPPSFFNIDTLMGLGICNIIGATVGFLVAGTFAAAVGGTFGIIPVMTAVAGMIAGTFIGGESGKDRMQKEYQAAEVQIAGLERHKAQNKIRDLSRDEAVTPEMAAELEAKIEAAKESAVDRISERYGIEVPQR